MAETLPTRLQFELTTPDRLVVHESVLSVTAPGKDGYLGILPGHAPLLSELKAGELAYDQSGAMHYLAVGGGFIEVLPERVTVLAETAEKPEEIDVASAERDRSEAEDRLKQAAESSAADTEPLRDALDRASARLAVAARRAESRK